MLIGEAAAVTALWDAARSKLPRARLDRPGQPVYALSAPPPPGETGLRPATPADLARLLPACAAAHELELGIDPLARDREGFAWRTAAQVDEGRSWVWLEGGVIRFKAEASAWTPGAVQLQQVWTDPEARGRGYASRALRDLCRLLLETTPIVTLFVRRENAPAIALYDAIGMHRVHEYRSILF
jgi:ribosomal protein S18 acetylase RimI-like enzyme